MVEGTGVYLMVPEKGKVGRYLRYVGSERRNKGVV